MGGLLSRLLYFCLTHLLKCKLDTCLDSQAAQAKRDDHEAHKKKKSPGERGPRTSPQGLSPNGTPAGRLVRTPTSSL